MSTIEPPDETDYAKSEQVKDAIDKIMDLNPPNPSWMTGELANTINAAQHGAYTQIQMRLIREGMPLPQAQELAGLQAPLLAFEVGMLVGAELEKNRQMRELFGE